MNGGAFTETVTVSPFPVGGVLGAGAPAAAENSEVLPAGSVAVAVTKGPAPAGIGRVTLNEALPAASVSTTPEKPRVPRKVFPSAAPNGSAGAAKNSMRKLVLGVLCSVPVMVTPTGDGTAEVSTGKFCRLFDPVSA